MKQGDNPFGLLPLVLLGVVALAAGAWEIYTKLALIHAIGCVR